MTNERLHFFLEEHLGVTRRHFMQSGVLSVAALSSGISMAALDAQDPRLQEAVEKLDSWLTEPDGFQDVSRGRPKPHSLSDEKRKEVGLTRETWKLDVVSDPDHPARIRHPLEGETAFTFADLMKLSESHAVRFPKVMTCLNVGCPLGNGIWEGVPLREVIWKTQPTENLR
ncbi:MAG: hypothetical protein GY826_21725, partial [Fuerstiella sp.]|nr:hypothetical protein [Fuerstiella sp.]